MFKGPSLKKLLRQRIKSYSELITQLPLDSAKKKQIEVDFINYIRILEKLAARDMLANDLTNVSVIILSALVPILINFTPAVKANEQVNMTYLNAATFFSVLLAILNGLRQSYKFRERWQNYRESAEELILEGQSYFALSGKYATFDTYNSAFPKFIDSVNAMRTKQINNYISQINSVNDQEVAKSVTDEVNARMSAINEVKEKLNAQKLVNDEINAYVKTDPSISYFETDNDRKSITLYASDQNFKGPDKFTFKNSKLAGLVYKVNVAFADAEIHSSVAISTGIKNKDMPSQGDGSVGCILKRDDGKVIFITCYHVVKHTSQDWDLFTAGGGHDDVIDTKGAIVGQIVDGEKSEELDTALVAINDDVDYDDLLPGQIQVQPPVFIDESNMNDYADVYILSRTRNFKQIQGKLSAVAKTVTLNYGSKVAPVKKDLNNLMIVHYVSTEPFSMTGDSGSLVFAADGTAIGLVVGGDMQRASFVIPFSTINDHYNLKFN